VLLVSAVFRKDQAFFKGYGRFYRRILFLFRHIFVQDEASLKLLQDNGIDHCSISGDTRFDRVQEIAEKLTGLPLIEDFIGKASVIVAGSTWDDDERILSSCAAKLIIAPHEINEPHLAQIEKLFKGSIRFSQLQNAKSPAQVLIIDNIGMLSRLYYYATITYVGGGFTRDGIHNILEAAVYGKPVLFGPNYKKYREAKELVETGGAFSVANAEELKFRLDKLLTDPSQLQQVSDAAKSYVQLNTGATQKVLRFIQEKRLLTK
jgi:3-deoxy-D-manno-octulosonic-acid transferase